jgi:ethanolamine ammonia-lyase small subunit
MSREPTPLDRLKRLTPARIGLGRVGASLPLKEVLDLQLAHARARDAVHTPLDAGALERDMAALGLPVLRVRSAAPDRDVYLRRPDLGRVLRSEDRTRLAEAAGEPVDLAIVVGDGLSAEAVHRQVQGFMAAFVPLARERGWRLAPIVISLQARVALGDEVARSLRARAVLMLIGERPGLSSPDSLGAYLTVLPAGPCTDADRNCLSNIREEGLQPSLAAAKAAWLLEAAFAAGATGVALKDESGASLLQAGPDMLPGGT